MTPTTLRLLKTELAQLVEILQEMPSSEPDEWDDAVKAQIYWGIKAALSKTTHIQALVGQE